MTTNVNEAEVRDEQLAKLAKQYLSIAVLDPRNSDSLDFHEVAVWDVKKALILAYEMGKMSK